MITADEARKIRDNDTARHAGNMAFVENRIREACADGHGSVDIYVSPCEHERKAVVADLKAAGFKAKLCDDGRIHISWE